MTPIRGIGIIMAIQLGMLCIGCSKPDNQSFYRIPGQRKAGEVHSTPITIHEGFFNDLYYSSKKSSFTFFGHSSSMAFSCQKSGYSALYFVLDSRTRDELVVSTNASAGSRRGGIPVKKGINEILLTEDFQQGDEISIASQSGNPFVASNPIFFKLLQKRKRELVFLISVDALAASHMGLYGYEKQTTRNIQEFSRDAVVFANAYSNSTWTVSAHMSLFTSLLEHGHGVHVKKKYTTNGGDRFVVEEKAIFPLPSSIPTLTEKMASDYLAFSFNGGGNVASDFGFFRGFDLYLSNRQDANDPFAAEKLFAKLKIHLERFPFPKVFYFLHTYQVHAPYNPLPENFPEGEPTPGLTRFDFYSDLNGMRGIFKSYPADFIRDVIALYDAEIRGFDSAFGRFLEYLKANELYDSAMIVLLSDHGEEFMGHGSWMHASNLYSDQLGIPLLIKFPGQKYKGKKTNVPVSLVDVMPTLLAAKRIMVPGKIHGRSLLDLLEGSELNHPPVISTLFRSKPDMFVPGKISVILDGFKLIYSEPYLQAAFDFFDQKPPSFAPFELFNLTTDRHEESNIFNSHKQDPVVKRMREEIANVVKAMDRTFSGNKLKRSPISDELLEQLRSLGYF